MVTTQILQGSTATHLRGGGNFHEFQLTLQFITEYNSQRIIKISPN